MFLSLYLIPIFKSWIAIVILSALCRWILGHHSGIFPLKLFIFYFIELFLCVFFKLFEFFGGVCLFFFSFLKILCSLLIQVIHIGKHFYSTRRFWRGDTDLIFHTACVLGMRPENVNFFCQFYVLQGQNMWGYKRGYVTEPEGWKWLR